MSSGGGSVEERITSIAGPLVREMGLDLVDVEFTRRDGGQILCIYVERDGGVTLNELQEASRAVETAIEIDESVRGRYRLEVSSPGINRPLKTAADFERHRGGRVTLKLRTPLDDGRRTVSGVVSGTEGEEIVVMPDGSGPLRLTLDRISRARPEIDWKKLLRKKPAPEKAETSGRNR